MQQATTELVGHDDPGNDARPWKLVLRRSWFAMVNACLALAAAVVVSTLGGVHAAELSSRAGAACAAVLAGVFGVLCVRSVSLTVRQLVAARGSGALAATVGVAITGAGYAICLLTVLALLSIPVERILVSGAITGVVLGIAAQQSLGNAFAGFVLLLARPFTPGDTVSVQGNSIGDRQEGVVTEIGLVFTTLQTGDGPVNLPNSGVLSAVTTHHRA